MNIFKPTTLTWWQVGALKWAVFLIGIAVGTHFSNVFLPYTKPLLIIGLCLSMYVGIVWYKQHTTSNISNP